MRLKVSFGIAIAAHLVVIKKDGICVYFTSNVYRDRFACATGSLPLTRSECDVGRSCK
jgi:hypothetical protein